MDIHIDYAGRVEKLCKAMESRGLDLFLGTRGKSVNYIAGAFVPWRSVLLASGGEMLTTTPLELTVLDA